MTTSSKEKKEKNNNHWKTNSKGKKCYKKKEG
jgi:hypothetical protein